MRIPMDALSREALDGLVQEFVTREGTEYGYNDVSIEDKTRDVLRQLNEGTAIIVFDSESQTTNIVPTPTE